jgi:hypothetical protein
MKFWIGKRYLRLFFSLFCGVSIFFKFLCRKIRKIALLRGGFFLDIGQIGYKNQEFFADFKKANLP